MIWLIFVFLTGAAVLAVLAPLAAKSASASDASTDKAFFWRATGGNRARARRGPARSGRRRGRAGGAARRLLRASETDGATAQPSNRKTRVVAALATLLLVRRSPFRCTFPSAPRPAGCAARRAARGDAASRGPLRRRRPNRGASRRASRRRARLRSGGSFLSAQWPLRRRHTRLCRGAAPARGDPTRYAALGEAYVMAAQGEVTPDARRVFDAALRWTRRIRCHGIIWRWPPRRTAIRPRRTNCGRNCSPTRPPTPATASSCARRSKS